MSKAEVSLVDYLAKVASEILVPLEMWDGAGYENIRSGNSDHWNKRNIITELTIIATPYTEDMLKPYMPYTNPSKLTFTLYYYKLDNGKQGSWWVKK
jgi:hypothetical protein